MEYGVCGFQACNKPITAQNRVACGTLHHLLLMVSRYLAITRRSRSPSSAASCGLGESEDAADDEEKEEEEEAAAAERGGIRDDVSLLKAQHEALSQFRRWHGDRCLFPSCKRVPFPGHRWCTPKHFLQWRSNLYQSLCPRQICRYPLCTRHVVVELEPGRGSVRDFCGWKHCQKYEMRSALGYTGPLATLTSSDKGFYPSEPSIEYLIKALKTFISNGDLPREGVKVDESFFRKHPWQVLQHPGEEYCLLIARCIYKETGVKRELMTKEEYHWKQQGRPTTLSVEGSLVSRRYLTYQKLQATKKREEDQVDHAFNLIEWMITDQSCKDYCLLKLAGQMATSLPNKRAKSIASCEVTAESTGIVTEEQADILISYRGHGHDFPMMSRREESSFNKDIFSATAQLDAIYSDLEPLQNFVELL